MRAIIAPLSALLLLFFAAVVCPQTPPWVWKYRKIVDNMEHQSGQTSLNILKRTRRGNCVAFAKLAAEIAIEHNLLPYGVISVYSAKYEREDAKAFRHMMLLVRSLDGRLWCVSNYYIEHVSDEEEAVESIQGTRGYYDWKVKKRGLIEEKRIFTDDDLEDVP